MDPVGHCGGTCAEVDSNSANTDLENEIGWKLEWKDINEAAMQMVMLEVMKNLLGRQPSEAV